MVGIVMSCVVVIIYVFNERRAWWSQHCWTVCLQLSPFLVLEHTSEPISFLPTDYFYRRRFFLNTKSLNPIKPRGFGGCSGLGGGGGTKCPLYKMRTTNAVSLKLGTLILQTFMNRIMPKIWWRHHFPGDVITICDRCQNFSFMVIILKN